MREGHGQMEGIEVEKMEKTLSPSLVRGGRGCVPTDKSPKTKTMFRTSIFF